MSVKDRLKKYLKEHNLTIRAFEKSIDASNGYVNSISKGIGGDKILLIIEKYSNLDVVWLLTGKGEMIKSKKDRIVELPKTYQAGTPLIPIEAMAGWGEGDVTVMDYDTKRYIVPEFDDLKVDFMIRVKGSSMYPKYNSGDIVACKKLALDTFFQWNKVYLLDTSQGAMIKRIKKSKLEQHILCVSDNSSYDPFDLDLKHLHSLALVVGVIRLE